MCAPKWRTLRLISQTTRGFSPRAPNLAPRRCPDGKPSVITQATRLRPEKTIAPSSFRMARHLLRGGNVCAKVAHTQVDIANNAGLFAPRTQPSAPPLP